VTVPLDRRADHACRTCTLIFARYHSAIRDNDRAGALCALDEYDVHRDACHHRYGDDA
jgi:hypothetical protein